MKSNKILMKVTTTALFIAISVVVGAVCKLYLTFGPIRITFENLTLLMSGIYCGPVFGFMAGVITDLISSLLSGQQGINPLITLGAGMIGLISGIISLLYKKNVYSVPRIAICSIPAHMIGNMIVKSIALMVFFSYPFELVLYRIPLYLGISVVEVLLIYLLTRRKIIRSFLEKLK